MNYKEIDADFSRMELRKHVDDRGRLARTILTGALAAVAIGSLRRGKRLSGALAGAGAVALGYQTTTGSDAPGESLDIASVGESAEDAAAEEATEREHAGLRCAACGEPIRLGQPRGPNENHEIVHESCRTSAA